MKKEITKEEYDRLDLKQALEYVTVTTCACETETCSEKGKELVKQSDQPPHEFIYAAERRADGTIRTGVYTSVKYVCTACMVVMGVIEEKYYHQDKDKYRVYTKKAAVDRSKNYYRDFTKTSKNTAEDPELAKNVSTKVTKADEEAFARNMKGKL